MTGNPIMFAVRTSMDIGAHSELSIYVGYVQKSNKNSWDFIITGSRSGQHMHLHKDKWILFSSLLGARAHVKRLAEIEIARLEVVIDSFYDVINEAEACSN